MGLVTFTVSSEGLPVSDVNITIFSNDGVVEGVSASDSEGKAVFDLIAGLDYFITANHPNYTITTYKLVGLELGTYDLIAVPKALKLSEDPDFCQVQGVFTDLKNARLDSWTFNVKAAEGYSGTDSSIFYGDMPVTAINGSVDFALVGGVTYMFSNLPFCETKEAYIPEARAASLADVLLPTITSIEGIPLGIALSKESNTALDLVLTLSNTLKGSDVGPNLVKIEVDDPELISVDLSSTYNLNITSKDKEGQTTVRVVPCVDPDNGIYARLPKEVYKTFTVNVG